MRKVVYLVASSLDGQIATDDGSFDCFVPEGEHVDDYVKALASFDDVLMGRATYEVGTKVGVTNPYPMMRSHVFSRTMQESPDTVVRLVGGNAAEYVAELKALPGRHIYLCGGGKLAAALLSANLIDEIVVKLNPLVIGRGIPLFEEISIPVNLDLVDCRPYRSGVVLLSYRVRAR